MPGESLRVRALAFIGLIVCLCAGCGSEDSGTAPESATAGTAAVGVGTGPSTLLPPLAASALEGELGAMLYLGLNYAEWSDGELAYPQDHPLALARSWKREGPTLTYRLDTGRRWSDGRPVVAADVVFTYEFLRANDHLPMSIAAARIDSVMAIDDSTVVFHFEAEYPGMLFDTGVGILPAHLFADLPETELMEVARARIDETGGLVGSGPFTVTAWRQGDRLDLVRNPQFSPGAQLARVVFRTLPDPTTRLAAFRSGELDLVQLDDYHDISGTVAAMGASVLKVPQRGYDYIAWNPAAHPAFAAREVREALSLSIDRSSILNALEMTDFAEKAYGPYGSIFGSLAPPPPAGGDFDPEAARRLLSDAGWVDRDGDGIRERDEVRFAFTLEVPAGSDRRQNAAQIVQAQLADVGVSVQIRMQEFNSLFTRARERDYEAVLLGWQVGLDPDISFFWADPESPVNVVGYDSPAVTSEIEQALASGTADGAAPHWREAARLIAADYPYAFLWYFDFAWLASPRLRGVRMDPVGFFRNPQEWSLSSEG
jgi:peptide/nickel transport system substrate-binding protein